MQVNCCRSPALPCSGLTLNSPLSTTAWPPCLFCWEPGPPALSWLPASVLQWSGLMWGCSSCLLPPPLTALISALQFTPDQQRLHFTQEFSIFYFLSPSRARPHHHHTMGPRPAARQVVPYNCSTPGMSGLLPWLLLWKEWRVTVPPLLAKATNVKWSKTKVKMLNIAAEPESWGDEVLWLVFYQWFNFISPGNYTFHISL